MNKILRNRGDTQKRRAYFPAQLSTRTEGEDDLFIEGYFVVFNRETELWDGCFEQIAPNALDRSIRENDIRALFNHNSDIVLGRNTAKTAEFTADEKGLFGRIKINKSDSQAMDIYARVQRGDISGCSFGFYPIKESYEEKDGAYHWTVEEADMMEVSVCTFPAYPQTEISARRADFDKDMNKIVQQRKAELKKRLEEIKC